MILTYVPLFPMDFNLHMRGNARSVARITWVSYCPVAYLCGKQDTS
jgi:hypothetical protein